jgi:hypothetical protein
MGLWSKMHPPSPRPNPPETDENNPKALFLAGKAVIVAPMTNRADHNLPISRGLGLPSLLLLSRL